MTDDDPDPTVPEPVAVLVAELTAAAARGDREAVARLLVELADHYGVGFGGAGTAAGP